MTRNNAVDVHPVIYALRHLISKLTQQPTVYAIKHYKKANRYYKGRKLTIQ